jgi:A/G-specific adenine glycosylase
VNEPHTIWLSIDDAIGAAIPTPIRKILIALKSY